jgi:hypothetical protein
LHAEELRKGGHQLRNLSQHFILADKAVYLADPPPGVAQGDKPQALPQLRRGRVRVLFQVLKGKLKFGRRYRCLIIVGPLPDFGDQFTQPGGLAPLLQVCLHICLRAALQLVFFVVHLMKN